MKSLSKFPTILFSLILITACNHERQVVPYEIDIDEIYKEIPQNEDESSAGATFGENHIPGITFDYEMATDNSEVYVFFENLTILDVNPAINQALFEFVQEQLCEYGFINDSVSLPKNEFPDLLEAGLTYSEASARILDTQKQAFEAQLDTIATFRSPFNIYFQIYPVFLNSKYVTYRQSSYCYTGGAHGMSIAHLVTYDLTEGKPLTLSDIVKTGALEDVRTEVAAHMAYSYPIYENITSVSQYIDSLNVWLDNFEPDNSTDKITLQNFPLPQPALIRQGLAFVYQMYQMAPGSDGCPIVVIPYKDIHGCLNIEP